MNRTNIVPFEGVLIRLDQPSEKAPVGASGHRVMVSTTIAAESLSALPGMAVDYRVDRGSASTVRRGCGVITSAAIVGDELRIVGHFFPDELKGIRLASEMRFHYEATNVHVEDLKSSIWNITKLPIKGAMAIGR